MSTDPWKVTIPGLDLPNPALPTAPVQVWTPQPVNPASPAPTTLGPQAVPGLPSFTVESSGAGYPTPIGFTRILATPRKRLILSLWGGQKVGKTHFANTFPEPIYNINLDMGTEGVVEKFVRAGRAVFETIIPMGGQRDSAEWTDLLDLFDERYRTALIEANNHSGTVVVDTATQLWNIVQVVKIAQARDERMAAVKPRRNETLEAAQDRVSRMGMLDYALANATMGGYLRMAHHHTNASAVFISRAREEFGQGGQRTGNLEYHGFAEMPAIAQMQIMMYRHPVTGVHSGRIDVCRDNASIENMLLEGPDFPKLKSILGLS